MSNSHDETRRQFLTKPVKILPAIALASTGLAMAPTTSAVPIAPGAIDPSQPIPVKSYVPTYFQEAEWKFIHAAVDVLIPEDEHGPGAIIAGVPEFIDRQMETPYAYGRLWYMEGPFHPDMMVSNPYMGHQINMNPRQIYRSGIKAFNAWCQNEFGGKAYADLDADKRLAAMTALSDKKVTFSDEEVLAEVFFAQLLSNAKEGFLSDPMYGGNKNMVGWKMVGFPGVRADYMDWIDHPNEPYPYGPVSITGEKA